MSSAKSNLFSRESSELDLDEDQEAPKERKTGAQDGMAVVAEAKRRQAVVAFNDFQVQNFLRELVAEHLVPLK